MINYFSTLCILSWETCPL